MLIIYFLNVVLFIGIFFIWNYCMCLIGVVRIDVLIRFVVILSWYVICKKVVVILFNE